MLLYGMLSKKGDRTHNEDCVATHNKGKSYCFVLADGLGGHGKGEVASQCVCDEVVSCFENHPYREDFLAGLFDESQQQLLDIQKEMHAEREMKTTMVVLVLNEEKLQWGHIGDSRLYYFHHGKLQKRTMDHSVPQMLAASGEIKEKEIRNHPDRNKVLRVMGQEWDDPRYEIEDAIAVGEKQAFLLCTDGFWELIDEKKMQKCLKKAKSPDEWLAFMEEIVLNNGRGRNMDNYSAIAVWIN